MNDSTFEYTIEEQALQDIIGFRKVTKKIDGWKNSYEFIELFTRIYVLDKGYRKVLPPFVKLDNNGNSEIDKKDWLNKHWDGTFKLRCFMVTKLVIPGYFKMSRIAEAEAKLKSEYDKTEFYIDKEPDVCSFEKLFGKSYKSLVEYMEEHSYDTTPKLPRTTVDIYELNFYEI